LTWRQLCALARSLPEVAEDTWYGTAALKVKGKGFVRLKEDGKSCVFFVSGLDEKEALLAMKPAVYFTTDHYNGHASVLARLAKLSVREARDRLDVAWRACAPKSLLRQK
jgi:hypothetical protein